ncbi:MAG: ATP-binding protein [Vicinamibacterales bacterium]
MARELPSRRLTPFHDPTSASPPGAAGSLPLISTLARTPQLIDLLPHLHQHAVDATGGRCSLLFEHNSRNGGLQATSGFGLDELRPDTWAPGPEEGALVADAFATNHAVFVADARRQAPDLAARLDSPAALLLPLVQGTQRQGLLAVGFEAGATGPRDWNAVAAIADGALVTLELFRLRRNEELQREIRQLFDEVSASLTTTLDLGAGLEMFCARATRLFGADRTSVWLHDRRSRHLTLAASSDPEHLSPGLQIEVGDALAPAAVALRSTRAEILVSHGDVTVTTVTVPLRGRRRALGTVVFDGVRVETGGELDLLDRADELGAQLAGAVENLQLLEDVIRSRRELENTFDSIAHLVVVSDQRGRIVHANKAFTQRVGLTREDLVQRPLAECIGPELAAWLSAPPRPGDQTIATLEVVDPVLDGPFMVTVTDLLDRDRQSVGRVLVARDLTPQSKLEAEREELRKKLTQSEKLAALGQFVAGIAHELNNPLQGVLGHLELLRATGAFPKQLRREVQTIYREADRAAKIVRNLLVFAGSRRLVNRAVSLTAVLQKVLALRVAAFRACDIELVRNYEESLPRVQSDPLLLHQVFLNIVMNAEQAVVDAGRPGRVEVTVRHDRAAGRLVATVRDTGNGIPEDALPRIFEPFYTTKEVGKGTGLGLAIAYGIMQEHGGHISAANHPEGGAVFTVELPAYPGSRARRERHLTVEDAKA